MGSVITLSRSFEDFDDGLLTTLNDRSGFVSACPVHDKFMSLSQLRISNLYPIGSPASTLLSPVQETFWMRRRKRFGHSADE